MKVRLTVLLLSFVLLTPAVCSAENATLEITQGTLNRIIGRVGVISDSGKYQRMLDIITEGFEICDAVAVVDCPGLPGIDLDLGFGGGVQLLGCRTYGGGIAIFPSGEPVLWQWWITKPYFTLKSGSMTFTATVRSQVGGRINFTKRTVPASVSFNSTNNKLVINIDGFKVPLVHQGENATEVDVAKFYSISIPIQPQVFTVPMLDGTTKAVTASAVSVSPEYLAGKIKVNVNVGF